MEKLYDFNHLPEYWQIFEDQLNEVKRSIHNWGGPLARRAALAIFTVMFLCLLRVDEVLKIKMEHIVLEDRKVILTLPFRKTHQLGGKFLLFMLIVFIWLPSLIDIKPFVLHLLPEEEAYLCPVRALADWISASGITSGYLFRRMAAGDRPSARDSPMASTSLIFILYPYILIYRRHRSNALKFSEITSSTLGFTHPHMVLTPSDAVDASGLLPFDGGSFDEYVTGEDGVRSFRALQLLNI
jgi:hypothetical protein